MEAILHIGSEKTGSTSLQAHLFNSRDTLLKSGILYPLSLTPTRNKSQWLLALASCSSYADIADLLASENIGSYDACIAHATEAVKGLANEVSESRPQQVIISSEHLSSRIRDQAAILKTKHILESIGIQNFKVVFYVRHPLLVAASQIATIIRIGAPLSLSADLLISLLRSYQPCKIMHAWSSVFGSDSLHVQAYKRDITDDWDVVDDFTSSFNLPRQQTMIKAHNKSPAVDELIILNECIKHYRQTHGIGDATYLNISKLLEHIEVACFDNPGEKGALTLIQRLSNEEVIRIADNELCRICDQYFNGSVSAFPGKDIFTATNEFSCPWESLPEAYRNLLKILSSQCIQTM